MALNRREFFLGAGGLMVSGALPIRSSAAPAELKAIAFDAFPIFDPRPVARLAESMFPKEGHALMELWRTKQFEYQWLRALAGQYRDFMHATEESLKFAAGQLRLSMSRDMMQKLIGAYADLKVWPDVPRAVETLRRKGFRLVFLSNMTHAMLERGLRGANLHDSFEAILSTDSIRTYKPDPRAYRLAVDALRLKREQILFAAFAAWDLAGAKWFGYPTFWVNRAGSALEELGVFPDAWGRDLNALVDYVS